MAEYNWPGNIRELENLVKRYVIVGNESQIIRELSTHKPIVSSVSAVATAAKEDKAAADRSHAAGSTVSITSGKSNGADAETMSLLEIGKRAAMEAEREAIERVLNQTRWNRRQAAKILRISYKALLNKLKLIEEQNAAQNKNRTA